jgi:uncharacterized protein
MRLLFFSDIHGDERALARLMEMDADYYIVAGDLSSWSRGLDPLGQILARRAPRVWVLPGNHENAATIADFCSRHGLNPFHELTFQVGEYTVAGFGYSNPTPFNTPGEYSEEEIATHLVPFAGIKKMILVCHCPPHGTALDRVGPAMHFGSRSIGCFIEQNQPEWFLCGHIHEAAGSETQLGTTRAVNVGKAGYVVEI